jgi:hypothetical protein
MHPNGCDLTITPQAQRNKAILGINKKGQIHTLARLGVKNFITSVTAVG